MNFLCFYVCCVLRGFDTGDFDSSGALGSVSFRCNNSRCQVPFQSLPSPLASPTFGIPPDRGECDAETIGLEQVEPGRVGVDRPVGIDDRAIERLPSNPSACSKQPWKARRSAADVITIEGGGSGHCSAAGARACSRRATAAR